MFFRPADFAGDKTKNIVYITCAAYAIDARRVAHVTSHSSANILWNI